MSKPREVLPNQFYLVTRRCTQRRFLMRPDDATNNAFIYCLGLAAHRHHIDVLLTVAESNHHHTVIYDREGNHPKFVEHFHKLFARSQNALRGRWENFWACEEVCIVRLMDCGDVIAKLVYTAINPVKDRLVERVRHWPGVNGYVHLMTRKPLEARRPSHFFRSTMPASVTIRLVIPSALGTEAEVVAEVKAKVEALEREVTAERHASGARIVGRRAILEQPWQSSPQSAARRNLRPRFAAQDPTTRMMALLRYREFQAAYRSARKQWLAGITATFPVGTYWLRHHAGVPIEAATVTN